MKLRRILRNGKARFQVDLGKVNGKRTVKTFRNERDAKEYLTGKKREAREHGRAALQLDDRLRYEAMEAERRLEGRGSILEAVEFYLASRPKEETTVEDLMDRCIADRVQANRRQATIGTLRGAFRRFAIAHGDMTASTVTAQTVSAWIRDNEIPSSSARTYLLSLRTLFNFGLKVGAVGRNPIDGITIPQTTQGMPLIYTPEEAAELLRAATRCETFSGRAIAFCAIGLFGGLRTSEIYRLSSESFDENYLYLDSVDTKKWQVRSIPLSTPLREWLQLARDRGYAPPERNWNSMLCRLRGRLPIKKKVNASRHSFATYHLAYHNDRQALVDLMGHRGMDVAWKHYLHRSRQITRDVASRYWAMTPQAVLSPCNMTPHI